MAKAILVTGARGTLGSVVTRTLLDHGHKVVGLTRGTSRPEGLSDATWVTGDLGAGTGLDRATDQVDTIVHCATRFGKGADPIQAANLLDAAAKSAVGHIVYISIVGVDKVPFAYYQAKLATEKIFERSMIGSTVLRATQFHNLIEIVLAKLALSPAMLVPAGMSDQPIDVSVVADRLVELAEGEPAGRVPDLGGPEVRTMRELAKAYLTVTGKHRFIVPTKYPGKAAAGFRAGGHLCPENAAGGPTFEEFLGARDPGGT